MDTSLNNTILAIVVQSDQADKVKPGGAPIFIADDHEELEQMSMLISRLTLSMVHEIHDGIRIIVKH